MSARPRQSHRLMPMHLKANAHPSPQSLPLHDPIAFDRLPPLVKTALRQFSEDGPSLLTAVESRICHLPKQEQRSVMSDFFAAIGIPVIEFTNFPPTCASDLQSNSMPSNHRP